VPVTLQDLLLIPELAFIYLFRLSIALSGVVQVQFIYLSILASTVSQVLLLNEGLLFI
jgi:hypothetical protein